MLLHTLVSVLLLNISHAAENKSEDHSNNLHRINCFLLTPTNEKQLLAISRNRKFQFCNVSAVDFIKWGFRKTKMDVKNRP